MLTRVLETEVMDSAEEALDYDRIDHAAVNRAFASEFLQAWSRTGGNPGGPILDIGTGTALIPIELCRQSSTARVIAVDAAASMLALARSHIQQAQLTHRIQVARVDAKRLPFRAGQFAAVISNSIVHHLPEPIRLFREAARVASDRAHFFFRDLLRPADESALRRLVDNHASDANSRQRRLFGDSLRAALTLHEVREIVASLGFVADTVQQTSNRHWTWASVR